MTPNRVRLVCAVTFMEYLARVVVSLIFLPKILIWNKITIRLPNLLNLAEVVVNELAKSISKKYSTIFLFLSELSRLIVKILRAYI